MNINSDYNKLYQHWLKEFEQKGITPLAENEINDYRVNLNSFNNYKMTGDNQIEQQLLGSYKKNYTFLLRDFLKIRELKIINAALALQEINLNNLLESEKLLFQNLVSSIKGYDRIKNLDLSQVEDEKIPEGQILSQSYKNNLRPINSEILIKRNLEPSNKLSTESEGEASSGAQSDDTSDFNYTLIRFIKKAPPLVGIDLKNYGPFKENDIGNIPFKNAKILILEKSAVKIDLS